MALLTAVGLRQDQSQSGQSCLHETTVTDGINTWNRSFLFAVDDDAVAIELQTPFFQRSDG